MQSRGYSGLCYNEISTRIGIEARHIEGLFPSLETLGAEVAADYRDAFMARLEASEGASTFDLLHRYASLFRKALVEDGRMCLCGMLGAEIGFLPSAVAREVRDFFECNVAWLTTVFEHGRRRGEIHLDSPAATEANLLVAVLEGAMLVARSTNRAESFDESVSVALRRYRLAA
ncbi:MAG: TetR family transcriptional regulator C-terminal domain-containing protein [Kiloniellales bacterium]|nr:TetR family transcriptional regulator C-terminal domain-containing protein [Kiloniellales bacterium]